MEDDHKYFYCWNCGAINSNDRNLAETDRGGVVYTDFPVQGSGTIDAIGQQSNYAVLNTVRTVGVAMRLGPDGSTPLPTYTPMKAEAVQGCWSCGCTNL